MDLYTLEEAIQILKKQECDAYGHNWNVIESYHDKKPQFIHCENCGVKYSLERIDKVP